MKNYKTILLLKIMFVLTGALCVFQFILALLSKTNMKMETYLFALRLPIEITDSHFKTAFSWYIFACALCLYLLILFIIAKLITLFKPLADGTTPFTAKSIATIKQIGLSCLIYAVISTTVQYVGAHILMNVAQTQNPNWNTQLSFPVEWVVIGIIILSFEKVFAQGFALKQDNDSIV